MSNLTESQIESKKQQLKQLAEEVKSLAKELAEAGVLELSEEDLDKVDGGGTNRSYKQYSSNPAPKLNWH